MSLFLSLISDTWCRKGETLRSSASHNDSEFGVQHARAPPPSRARSGYTDAGNRGQSHRRTLVVYLHVTLNNLGTVELLPLTDAGADADNNKSNGADAIRSSTLA